jgi:hypothetical protein
MSDENPQRPNANYSLSKTNKEEEQPLFHYNRERRLESAPQSVKGLYTENKKPGRFGIFSSLVADKPRAALFFTIIALCMIIFILTILDLFDTSHSLEGNDLLVSGTRYEGVTIIVLRKSVKRNTQAYTGAVNIAVSIEADESEDFPVFYHRVFFSYENEEEYRFAVPFENPELLMVLQTERSSLQIKLRPE